MPGGVRLRSSRVPLSYKSEFDGRVSACPCKGRAYGEVMEFISAKATLTLLCSCFSVVCSNSRPTKQTQMKVHGALSTLSPKVFKGVRLPKFKLYVIRIMG